MGCVDRGNLFFAYYNWVQPWTSQYTKKKEIAFEIEGAFFSRIRVFWGGVVQPTALLHDIQRAPALPRHFPVK